VTYTPSQIIGIDLSLTRTGIAMVDGCESVKTHLAGMARLKHIRDEVLAACGARTRLAVVEGYSMGGQRGSAGNGQRLGELGGVVRLALYELGVHVVDVPPASLKKFAVGDRAQGDRDKDAMLIAAVQQLPWDVSNNDEADAAWLMAMGLYHYGLGSVGEAKFRDEAVAKVAWPDSQGVAA
jgi:Holliday junction resolvasome RuvABC endonuclease subunit